jgi:SAM-dependent methyltransferase
MNNQASPPNAPLDENQRVYADPSVVGFYKTQREPHAAERVVFERLAEELPKSRVLDLGIGSGRTTAFLVPRSKEYVGVDISAPMVEAARQEFAALGARLEVADARALPYDDASFDLVVFSYNGIDYVDHADRLRILCEAKRVLRPGGHFFFSTHNLARSDLPFETLRGGFLAKALGVFRRARLRRHNPDWRAFASSAHALVRDGAYRFRLTTYHIRVEAQLAQLVDAGFSTELILGRDGREVSRANTDVLDDAWFHLVCQPRDANGGRQ